GLEPIGLRLQAEGSCSFDLRSCIAREVKDTIMTLDGVAHEASTGERLIDVINRAGIQVPQVCYHAQLGPIQTCDTCMVEVNGKLERACAAVVADAMKVSTNSPAAAAAQRAA